MKNRILILLLISCSAILGNKILADTQRGIVRTMERPGYHSRPVSDVLLFFKGLHNQQKSGKNGEFSINTYHLGVMPGDSIVLLAAKKDGFELSDKSKLLICSMKVPMDIVMCDLSKFQEEKRQTENRLWAENKRIYQQRLNKLKMQLDHQNITMEKYRTQLNELQQWFERNQALVSTLAERYASTDYMGIDSLTSRVNIAIENGNIELADSLLSNSVNLENRFNRLIDAEKKLDDRSTIIQRVAERIDSDRITLQRDKEILGQLLYNKATIAMYNMRNDSVAHYLIMRADLDTLNISAQLDAGDWLLSYFADYDRTFKLFKRGLSAATKKFGQNSKATAACLNIIGKAYHEKRDFKQAYDYYSNAKKIRENIIPADNDDLAQSYNNIGTLAIDMGKYDIAGNMITKAIDIWKSIYGDNHPEVATGYSNISAALSGKGLHAEALNVLEKSLSIRLEKYGHEHLSVAENFNSIGLEFTYLKQYDQAIKYHSNALEITNKILGNTHNHKSATYLSNLGMAYYHKNEKDTAAYYFQKALDIRRNVLDESNPDLATSYEWIGTILKEKKEYEKAFTYYRNTLQIRAKALGTDHPSYGMTLNNIGLVYYNMGDYDNAIKYIGQGLKIIRNSLGNTHRKTILLENNLRDCENLKRMQNGQ